LACFPVAIGLTAGTCRLDTGIWLALANILAPILDIVDLNPEVRAHPYSKEAGLVKEETLIIRDSIREPELSSRSGLPIPDTQIQQPALMTENLKPGQLMRVTKKFPGRFVLACYDDASFVQLIEKARSRAEKDLMLLQSGWAKSLEAPSILGMAEPHVQVEVSCLAVCYQPALGRFVVSNKALVNRLADQFILLAAEKSSSIQCPVDWTQRTNCLRAWKELARRIVNACNSTENLIIGMTAEASKLLMEYLREATRRDGVRSSDHLCSGQLGPRVAAKHALCFHLCISDPQSPVSAQVMKDAIGMARWLVRTTAHVKAVLGKEQRDLRVRRNAERLLARIPESGRIGWRALRRRFHSQTIAVQQPALDYLRTNGQIERHADGFLERASH